MYYAAFDIGGSAVKYGLVNEKAFLIQNMCPITIIPVRLDGACEKELL